MAHVEKFGKRQAIRFGWDRMKDNIVFYIFVLLLAWIITGGLSSIGQISFNGIYPFAPFGLLSAIANVFFSIAFIRISLRIHDGEKPEPADLWADYRLFWKYLGGSILYFLIVLGGLILLIVPGIVWALKYSQYGFLIVDRKMGPVEAIKASGRITDDAKWDLFLLNLLFFGVILLGAIALGVGLLVAVPIVMIARALVYRQLFNWTARAEMPAAPGMPPMAP
jgi:hypothetical protein